ncbi:hypothetical protein [Mycoplana azooxidifex]|uniref:hypothetical protein n=1 Tax=Mycoplana azooxidifex TaxID=1636188 RepID=UPI00160DF09D|nr:hypothetical protein [Mycoplana azooxidifex]
MSLRDEAENDGERRLGRRTVSDDGYGIARSRIDDWKLVQADDRDLLSCDDDGSHGHAPAEKCMVMDCIMSYMNHRVEAGLVPCIWTRAKKSWLSG